MAGSATNATAGNTGETTITFTQAKADLIAKGEAFRWHVTRVAAGTSGSDDVTDDAYLVAVEIDAT